MDNLGRFVHRQLVHYSGITRSCLLGVIGITAGPDIRLGSYFYIWEGVDMMAVEPVIPCNIRGNEMYLNYGLWISPKNRSKKQSNIWPHADFRQPLSPSLGRRMQHTKGWFRLCLFGLCHRLDHRPWGYILPNRLLPENRRRVHIQLVSPYTQMCCRRKWYACF